MSKSSHCPHSDCSDETESSLRFSHSPDSVSSDRSSCSLPVSPSSKSSHPDLWDDIDISVTQCSCDYDTDCCCSHSDKSSSYFYDLRKGMKTLHHYLNNRSCQIQSPNRHLLSEQLEKAALQLRRLPNSSNFDIMSDNTRDVKAPDSLINKMSEEQQLDILNNCWISQTESGSTPTKIDSELLPALRCFLLLEETAFMKKRDLLYWWVGQGVIDVEDGKDAEEAADVILKKLVEAGVIEQVNNSRKYRLTRISHQLHQIKEDHQNLVGLLSKQGTKLTITYPNGTIMDKHSQASIETLFNPSVSVLNIEHDWLRKMKNLKVLHMGRWSTNPEQHIEVENVEFLRSLKYLKRVRFVSFKGLSGIMELANEICQLGENLRVLDLQACPNLEALPKEIGKLRNLTHLDLSECYLLDRIPKEIISLKRLQVFNGFVIGDVDCSSSCKFKDLGNHLGTTLRKLSIRTRKVSFPIEEDLKAFAKFEKLLKLKIEWIKISDLYEEEKTQEATSKTKDGLQSRFLVKNLARTFRREDQGAIPSGLPTQLRKLEVHAIPQMGVNNLLVRNNERLNDLKKLYIIGGELIDFTDDGKIKWKTVKRVRLRYLNRLYMTWRQLKASFPHITYFEMTQCPYLTFFPCDQNGIWKLAKDH